MTTPTPTTPNAPALAPRPSWIQEHVALHEKSHGPLPDVVATQGQHLVTQPHTPVFPALRSDIHAFVTELTASLSVLTSRKNRRRLDYGVKAAEEWPIGRTPPKVRRAQKERLKAKLRASLEEDSESDIEAIPDSHYPLSPAPSASQSSPSLSSVIESKFALNPRGFEFDSETNVEAMKRDPKQMEEANDHAGDTERMRKKTKAGYVPGFDEEPQKISMIKDSEAYGRYSSGPKQPNSQSETADCSGLQLTAQR